MIPSTTRSPARPQRLAAILCLLITCVVTAAGARWDYKPSSPQRRAIAAIEANSLRAHLSFLSSAPLQGRGNGTLGLDVAAEYIAAQFRRAGLKPAGDDGYFQTTPRLRLTANAVGYLCRFSSGGTTVDVAPDQFGLQTSPFGGTAIRDLQIDGAPVVKLRPETGIPANLGDLSGRVIVTEALPSLQSLAQNTAGTTRVRDFVARLNALKPAAFVAVGPEGAAATGYFARSTVTDAAQKARAAAAVPVAVVNGAAVRRLYEALPDGETGATLSIHVSAPTESSAPQRNVIGLLPGSDPSLSDHYLLLTAHYDGQGRAGVSGWNSANDNGSGTVTVIEIAAALASLRPAPKRSIVFIAFHGEESGLVGSRYYAEHPLFPIEKTVAEINVEMVGRTDDVEGDQHKRASVTGFDYSDVGEVIRRAGVLEGITVFKHPKNSDPYFSASDNQPMANLGVPAHTVCVTFQYPDYHGAADTWDKIDYDNMALTVRMIATSLLILSESADEPRWDPSVSRASRYLQAWQARRGGAGK